MSDSDTDTPATTGRKTSAGLFDVRNIIGALLTIYGVVLAAMGLFNYTADDKSKTGGFNINLWSGLIILVCGILMIAWAVTRPILVPVEEGTQEDNDA
ncbi:hypothetical protein [Branchiibius sp. NY16-3462-2]|uniref:hypothetical protein n=1 Tax=Branchiibius sp. NY16-3462-2 TaxID=1807500 RepID=UPI000797F60D|nr:hypothetical protein [Branchiibius sp. NY16-3462-2]KYH43308.1 hypothetical protein AZH51_13245 [Branchiibius sp. NY16-3462-2]